MLSMLHMLLMMLLCFRCFDAMRFFRCHGFDILIFLFYRYRYATPLPCFFDFADDADVSLCALIILFRQIFIFRAADKAWRVPRRYHYCASYAPCCIRHRLVLRLIAPLACGCHTTYFTPPLTPPIAPAHRLDDADDLCSIEPPLYAALSSAITSPCLCHSRRY